ncbi:MAG TPA: hypothetical protein VGO92_03795, partial [Acidimicrobiales bacterium]|nr:hypothetical protein [Acidimicrobiales bacterium]
SGAGPLERELLSATSRVAERVAAVIPRRLSDVVRVLVVPVTDVADEVMFLRVLQLFEVVFAGMARSLTAGRDALERGDEDTATTEIRQAATTLTRAIPFFRILGTMSAESFARIRTMTPGASGLQSDSFKQIELTCSRQTPDRMGLLGYTEPNIVDLAAKEEGRPTIEELVEAGPPPPALLEGMVKLDKEWAQWKRTYWAIAVRLIGDSPGTGGTAGAAYPRHHVAGPLFPMLHG